MRAPEAFQPVAANLSGAPQPLGVRSTIIGQRGRVRDSGAARFLLMLPDLGNAMLHGRRHRLVHALGVGALHKVGRPAVTPEQVLQFLVADARQKRRVVDLVSVEVEDRQNSAIANRVEELVDVPGGRQRSRFRLRRRPLRPRRSGRDCRRQRRRRGRARSPVRRLHGSSPASRACSGCRCRPETRTA